MKIDDGFFTRRRNFLKTAAQFLGSGGRKTATEFLYATVDKTGHKISTKKPALCEVGGKSSFQKVISLIAIFEERQIRRGEHIVLHFDTAANAIPMSLHIISEYKKL